MIELTHEQTQTILLAAQGLHTRPQGPATKADVLDSFRRGWAAAITGDTIPASKLREFIEHDE